MVRDMPYLSAELPFPDPDIDSAGFWAHVAAGRLMFQACDDCGHVVHPPLPTCPACQSRARGWRPAPPVGRVFSYTIAHYPSHPSVEADLPYNIVLVEFPGLPGPRLVSNVVDVAPEELAIGLEVVPVFEPAGGGRTVVRFRRKD